MSTEEGGVWLLGWGKKKAKRIQSYQCFTFKVLSWPVAALRCPPLSRCNSFCWSRWLILAAISEAPAQGLGQGSQLRLRSCRCKGLTYILRLPREDSRPRTIRCLQKLRTPVSQRGYPAKKDLWEYQEVILLAWSQTLGL